MTRRAPVLPGGRFVADGDSAVVVVTRDIRPREQCPFGAYQLCHADRVDLVRRVAGGRPVPVLWNWAGTEAPEVSFEVAGAVSAVAVAVGVGFPEQAGADGLRPRVVGVDVVDDHVDPSAADVAAMQILGAIRLDQDSTASGSYDRADPVDDLGLESERFREPGQGGAYVTVGQ